jgi:hypothetical protein
MCPSPYTYVYRVFQKRALQMLLYGEFNENVYTLRRTNYPSFNILRMQIRRFVRNSVCKCFIRSVWQKIACRSAALPVEVALNQNYPRYN